MVSAFVMSMGILILPASGQMVRYVDAEANGGNTGVDRGNAYTDLQSALTEAGTPGAVDQIWVAAGTYKPSVEVGGTGARCKTFQMINNVEIYGGFPPRRR